jgi:hypothetical protein
LLEHTARAQKVQPTRQVESFSLSLSGMGSPPGRDASVLSLGTHSSLLHFFAVGLRTCPPLEPLLSPQENFGAATGFPPLYHGRANLAHRQIGLQQGLRGVRLLVSEVPLCRGISKIAPQRSWDHPFVSGTSHDVPPTVSAGLFRTAPLRSQQFSAAMYTPARISTRLPHVTGSIRTYRARTEDAKLFRTMASPLPTLPGLGFGI